MSGNSVKITADVSVAYHQAIRHPLPAQLECQLRLRVLVRIYDLDCCYFDLDYSDLDYSDLDYSERMPALHQ
jgi:hypothetical protein